MAVAGGLGDDDDETPKRAVAGLDDLDSDDVDTDDDDAADDGDTVKAEDDDLPGAVVPEADDELPIDEEAPDVESDGD